MATPVSNSVPLLTGSNNNNGTLTDEFISGLAQGSSWVGGTLTYSFSINDTEGNQPPWTAAYISALRLALTAWSNVANINFVESGSGTVFMSEQ